jgi:hypothetical protein
MQLRAGANRTRSPRPLLLVAVAAFLVAAGEVQAARGADSSDTDQTDTDREEGKSNRKKAEKDEKDDKNGKNPLEDTATKRVGMEFAGYNDSDHISVLTPSIHAGLENVSGASLNASYLIDVVSAASADIVSTASRRWQETRNAGTLSAQFKPHDFGVGVGGSISSEPDYLSYGFYATVVKDFAEKNWTLNFGYGFSHDTAGRCGADGACTPFSVFSRDLQRGSFNGGIAWVVDRASLASLSADLIIENGDQSKVYRYIPMFTPDVAASVPNGASIDGVNAHRLDEKPLEQLPLERHRFAITARYAHRYDESTLRLEERFYDDDWGLVASSTDARWIFDLGKRFALWPHARFHAQNGVSFWEKAYVSANINGDPNTWNLPLYRTGDRELGPLWTLEGGAGFRWYLGSSSEPRTWQLGFAGDVMYTSFLDDLYLLNRTGFLGALTLESEW